MEITRPRLAPGFIKSSLFLTALVTFSLVFVITEVHAQAEVGAIGGYQFGGKLTVREGDLSANDAGMFGFFLDYTLREDLQLEISYTHQETQLKLKEFPSGLTQTLFDMAIDYFQIGGLYLVDAPGNLKPFGMMTLGVTNFNPQPANRSSEWRFSITFGGGAKLYLSERFGMRVQGGLLLPMMFSGGGLWCGTGGCSVGLGGGTAIVQGNVSGGLFIAF